MIWVRIDNRLVHGQIIESWLPFTGAQALVVANDDLRANPLQQEIISLAIPPGVEIEFVRVENTARALLERVKPYNRSNVLLLFIDCKDARRAFDKGLVFDTLNIGNMHYGAGKRQLCSHIAVSQEDEDCLRYFISMGVELDFRCVPNDSVQVKVF